MIFAQITQQFAEMIKKIESPKFSSEMMFVQIFADLSQNQFIYIWYFVQHYTL